MRLSLRPQLIDEVADQVLPLRLGPQPGAADVAAQPLTLTELLYCGANDHGDGILLGVIDEGQGAMRAASLTASDCGRPLADIAARELRLPSAPEWVEAGRIRLAWQPWRLTLAIIDAAGAARPGFMAPDLREAGQVARFATSGLQPLTGPGEKLRFDLAVAFRRDGILIDVYPGDSAGDPSSNFPSEAAFASQINAAPPESNVIAAARYPFINQLLAIYSATFDIPLNLQGITTTVLARDLSLSGGENQASLTGKVISPSLGNLVYDARVDCAGQDLAVQQVAMEAEAVTACNQANTIDRLQCQVGQMAAPESGRALATALTAYYQNQPLHISTHGKPLRLTFGGVSYDANFAALKTSSHDGVLIEAGQASLQRVSPR
jgi:hypothetical protein